MTNPDNLCDNETGIYVLGDNADPAYPYFGANFWWPWEKPAHIELFEIDGSFAFSQDVGISICEGQVLRGSHSIGYNYGKA